MRACKTILSQINKKGSTSSPTIQQIQGLRLNISKKECIENRLVNFYHPNTIKFTNAKVTLITPIVR